MKLERKSHGMSEGDVFYVEPRHAGSLVTGTTSRKMLRRFIIIAITAVIASAATIGFVRHTAPQHFGLAFALEAAQGKVALTQIQLRDVVVGEGLDVYWLGPEIGARYALVSVNKNQNYVRYLPGGVGLGDAGANFRVVGTYKVKDAFHVTKNEVLGAKGSSFVNDEGNSVFAAESRPLSVFVGVKNSDDQIELFNPIAGQALTDSKTTALLKRIT